MIDHILQKPGNTPVVRLQVEGLEHIRVLAKLEYMNPTGSVKDRAASYLIEKLQRLGEIDKGTTLIESTSGNFGIALSTYCRYHGLNFHCVIDPNISAENEMLIRMMGCSVSKVTERDATGGFLLTRIQKVAELKASIPNSYWVNQYQNPFNAEAYYHTLGNEMCDAAGTIDYVFLGVSSGGTITGVSRKVKERFPNATIVAVDIEGSVIFGGKPQKRYIPGIGSSMVPEILKSAHIDEVIMIDELTTVRNCHELYLKHSLFAGGSSGSVYAAIKQFFNNNKGIRSGNAIFILADRGERYMNTIYNRDWFQSFEQAHLEREVTVG